MAIGIHVFCSSMVHSPILWTCIKGKINRWSDYLACIRGSNISDERFLAVVNNTNREKFAFELWFKRLTLRDIMTHYTNIEISGKQVKQLIGNEFF